MTSEAVKCCVYWIHHPSHTDVLSQGYVGITVKPPKYRLAEHTTKASSGATLPISRAIARYGDELLMDVLVVGSQGYCMDVEEKLRPSPKIGWNIAIGGQASGTTGIPRTQEVKDKLSAANKGRKVSDAARAKISASQVGRKHSEATKAKIALGRQGKTHTAETKAKMSASHKLNIKE